MSSLTLDDIKQLSEDIDLEVKLSLGKDGKGEFPDSFRETYSAMANTNGGMILLGIEEKPKGKFNVRGIQDIAKVKRQIWETLNNTQRVSANILNEERIKLIKVEGLNVLSVTIPRVPRHKRPIFIGQNPLQGTYLRHFDGDYKCNENTVKRMLADQNEESRDSIVLPGFSMKDFELETIKVYRSQFISTKPDHPWNDCEEQEFLRNLGGWGINRENDKEGPTIAGIIMFGRFRSIHDALPNYLVDYREISDPHDPDKRWTDRITTDGSWSGNLFDFYRKVIRRLTTDLKVPFHMEGVHRSDDTSIHQAIREALVNTIIHADHEGRLAILVEKYPDRFMFSNPGTMRIAPEVAKEGGTTDCRNRNLQKMFHLAGLGEQAGSGMPKIFRSWKEQHWHPPRIKEDFNMVRTLLELRMSDLLPREVTDELFKKFGNRFRSLPETARMALCIAMTDEYLTHSKLKEVCSDHPADISKTLSRLKKEKFLESDGVGTGTYYYLYGSPNPMVSELFPDDYTGDLTIPPSPDKERIEELKELAIEARRGVVEDENRMFEIILQLCFDQSLSLMELAEILNRKPEDLRGYHIKKLIENGKLKMQFPDNPRHPKQRYWSFK